MPLQKSFSEQNHSSKRPRTKWQRNKSNPDPQNHDDSKGAKQLGERYQAPISSATKNKLNVFQYASPSAGPKMDMTTVKQTSDTSSADKENSMKSSNQAASATGIDPVSDPVVRRSQINFRIDGPSTPAGRLALKDLIGMADTKSVEEDVSPDERVMWDYDTSAAQNSSSSYKALKRVKKRARSSSPVSSPSHGATFDLHPLSQSLTTPSADPGHELWGRYGLSTGSGTLHGPQVPALANIMSNSSPQSSRDSTLYKSESNLRRSIGRSNSCGVHFPKKRKIYLGDDQQSDDVFVESLNPGLVSSAYALLEKAQEGRIADEKLKQSMRSSSSSPTPHTTHFPKMEGRSTLHPIAQESVSSSEQAMLRPLNQLASDAGRGNQTTAKNSSSSSSDYGDIDDDAFNETIDATVNMPSPSRRSIATSIATLNSHELSRSNSLTDIPTTSNPISPNVEVDEFDELDDDVCAEDLENIVAKYDLGVSAGGVVYSGSGQGEPIQDARPVADSNNAGADSDDEYGDDFADVDFDAAEAAATQELRHLASSLPLPSRKSKAIQRYLVTNVMESQFETPQGRLRQEKVLFVQVEETIDLRTVHLRDGWLDTSVTPKAFIHVIGNFKSGRCVIDDQHNMIILHPDHLISSTVVADSFSCTRRAVLQDRVKATSGASPPLVYGTMLHEIFQAAMMANKWDSKWLNELIATIVTRHLEDLYVIRIEMPDAVEYLKSKMCELQSWAELYVASEPKSEAVVEAGNGETANMCINKLLDVEEHIWSPMYGLKGNIDATVQVTLRDGRKNRTLTVPFEVKTGKSTSASHRAQTALYNLMLGDRYGIEIACGILYYMETSKTHRVPVIRHELRHMIMQRNELACFVRERHAQLPPMLKKESLCNRCYAQTSCFIYHRLADDGNGETSGMRGKFDEVVKHLTPKHKEFFLKWDNLLTKEEKESLKFRRELWTMVSSEREKRGRCFSNVFIEPGSVCEEQSNSKINRYQYTMIKQEPPSNFSFLESQITVGEPIVISDEKGNFALANGFVTNVRKRRITVAVDRRLHNARIRGPGFDEVDNQVFAGIMEVTREGSTIKQPKEKISDEKVLYRLDQDEFSNGMATVRNNLIQVMSEGPFGSREIRNLVVDLVAPQFKPHSTAYTLVDRANINIDQRRAIEKVMSAQDYALVLGMPGTGKTTTIAHIIRALASQGKSVLLTSYTHSAVDNILLKLKDDKIPVLRLGIVAKVHPDVQDFAILAAKPKRTFQELRSSWHDTPVVATTCLGINHPLFNERTFDYCIVDEASQITLPVCLGPIRMARTFVLVGDHNQLPPLVQNEAARIGGLDISLFKHLSDVHPFSVVNLEHQYRMCEDVMALSNNLIYNGRLKCGTPEVAARSIIIPKMEALKKHHYSSTNLSLSGRTICTGADRGRCWLRDLLDPSTKVSFVNTDPLLPASREEAKGNRIVNETEAKICIQLVDGLLSVGVVPDSIGIMTHYRSQLALLKHGLRRHRDVEMHTADRFQGRDKEVVILSLVRSNEAKSIGELLKDWRRINVAFTRAKTKLLVVGSRETLKGNASEEMVARFVRLMEDRGWVYDLPKGALESHLFEDQVTASAGSQSAFTQAKQEKEASDRKNRSHFMTIAGKENMIREPKQAKVGERALLAGKPVLRDIVNDLIGSGAGGTHF